MFVQRFAFVHASIRTCDCPALQGRVKKSAYFLTLLASILIDRSSSFVEKAVSTANGFSIVMLHGVVMHRLLNKKHGPLGRGLLESGR
jgi:hypothetical protein